MSSDFPSLKRQFFHLTDDAKLFLGAVWNKQKLLSDEAAVDQRISACLVCPEFSGGRCTKCGCVMQLKVRIDVFKCPLGKW